MTMMAAERTGKPGTLPLLHEFVEVDARVPGQGTQSQTAVAGSSRRSSSQWKRTPPRACGGCITRAPTPHGDTGRRQRERTRAIPKMRGRTPTWHFGMTRRSWFR
jgi:hypothetical protein